jgi:class 3 adenylate cyclase
VVDAPETRFTRLGEDRIAYQVVGDGPLDLVYTTGNGEVVDTLWECPPYARLLERLSSFSRLITFDRRGTGASDPAPTGGLANWETWADDARAVLDAVGSEQAAFLALTDGGPTAILFAASHPARTRALVLYNTAARFMRGQDYPCGLDAEEGEAALGFMSEAWGTEAIGAWGNPDLDSDSALVRWFAKSQRMAHSPRAAVTYMRWLQRADVRDVLPAIRAPTLVLHRTDAPYLSVDHGRYLAEHIRGARLVPLPGRNLSLYAEPNTDALEHIEEFLTRFERGVEPDRALAAILFTDIVGSTSQAATLGDRRWRNLLDSHDIVARTLIDQHRGHLVKMTGDGVLARFDGPGRAIRCAFALRDALEPLGIQIRAGLHTGEIELRDDDIGGIAVHIAQRVHIFAEPGEVLVSETTPRLVTGSGIEFTDRGEHELKGVPGTWKLYAVSG